MFESYSLSSLYIKYIFVPHYLLVSYYLRCTRIANLKKKPSKLVSGFEHGQNLEGLTPRNLKLLDSFHHLTNILQSGTQCCINLQT
jgi:hypothetical protein